MKNVAIIIAGGIGSRMGQEIPKQFINVYDKPVIIYTLEAFQNHPLVDDIYVVCIDGWHDILRAYSKQFGITKLRNVFSGGASAQESIRNGVLSIEKLVSEDDNIIIHDGVRPLVEPEVLSDVIAKCSEYGNAVTSMPYNEQIFVKKDEKTTVQYIPRETLKRVSTPQAYKYSKLRWAYEKAFSEKIGIGLSSYTNTMMVELGETLYFASGSDKNIKLTTKENLEMFKAFLQIEKLMTDNSSSLYREDVSSVLKLDCNWFQLRNKTILITGATGLIGTYLTDMFLLLNEVYSLDLKLILLSRHEKKTENPYVKYIVHDVNEPFEYGERLDYVIHAASNTHPVTYSTQPIETITTNIFGTKYLLDLICKNPGSRFLLLSSVEIYGNDDLNKKDGLKETDMGYLDCNTTRAGYCESKRLCESLCQAYISQKNADCVIARLCRCYGPTLKKDDSKALSQFLRNGIEGKDIVLKSKGDQYFSYLYASDAACALIFLLLNGKNGEAYNVADKESDITLKDLAELIARNCGTQVVYDLPGETESKGFSKATRAILDSSKINALGWKARFGIEEGIDRTISLMRGMK